VEGSIGTIVPQVRIQRLGGLLDRHDGTVRSARRAWAETSPRSLEAPRGFGGIMSSAPSSVACLAPGSGPSPGRSPFPAVSRSSFVANSIAQVIATIRVSSAARASITAESSCRRRTPGHNRCRLPTDNITAESRWATADQDSSSCPRPRAGAADVRVPVAGPRTRAQDCRTYGAPSTTSGIPSMSRSAPGPECRRSGRMRCLPRWGAHSQSRAGARCA
jgi:hypothetical protein